MDVARFWGGLSTAEKVALVGTGAVVVGGLAYLLGQVVSSSNPTFSALTGGGSTLMGPAASTAGTAAAGAGTSYTPVGPLPPGSPGAAYQDQINQQWANQQGF